MQSSEEFGLSFANNAHLNYSVMRYITDFTGLEKGNIKKDYQKFIFNGKQGYITIFKILGGTGIDVERKGSVFDDVILNNSSINSSSYNPRAFALVFEAGIDIRSGLFFNTEKMIQLVNMIQDIEKGTHSKIPHHVDVEGLEQYLSDSGITSKNIIRYIHFLEIFVKKQSRP